MGALSVVLVSVGIPDPHESLVRSRWAFYQEILDLERAAGGGTRKALDIAERILFLQYCDGVTGGARERGGESVDGRGLEYGG